MAAAVIEETGGVDQMQLHKLLYLIQAAHLSWFGEPAFDNTIEAWKYGPMVRGVAGRYMQFDRGRISEPIDGEASALSDRLRWTVGRVVDEYGALSGPRLARLVKAAGMPWREVRGDLPDDQPSNAEIPQELMAEFHRKHGVTVRTPKGKEKALVTKVLEENDSEALAELFELVTGVRPTLSEHPS